MNVLEYNFYFNKGIRKILFFGFLILGGLLLWTWIIRHLLGYFRLGKVISHEQAATIIGAHFTNVKDKLLNILQLKQQASNAYSMDLINASIEQKTAEIKIVPFPKAIDLGKNRKFLPYVLPPALLLFILLLVAPNIIKDSTDRIIRNNEEFAKPAPFSFIIDNSEDLEVIQFEDYSLDVKVDGSVLPTEAFIEIESYPYKMTKTGPDQFSYTFKNVNKNASFKLTSGIVRSREFELNVLSRPKLGGLQLKLDYPSYTGLRDISSQNNGDVIIPEGTRIKWNLQAFNTDSVSFQFGNDDKLSAQIETDNSFSFDKRIYKDSPYKLFVSNNEIPWPDSFTYNIGVIKDQYPTIEVQSFNDSLQKDPWIYFAGEAGDDYGIKRLTFNYTTHDPRGIEEEAQIKDLTVKGIQTPFKYSWDYSEISTKAGYTINYFFEVFDNDGIHGSKSTKSRIMTFKLPSMEEIEEKNEENSKEIKEDLAEALERTKKLQKDINKFKDKLLTEKKIDWQHQKELEQLMQREKEIKEQLQKAQEKLQENMENMEKFGENNEELLEKMEKLQELFNELENQKLEELMEKFEELFEKMEKEDLLEMMEEMSSEEKETEMELDRLLELFKQMEVEQQVKEQLEKIQELAKKEDDLRKDTEEQSKEQEDLIQEQKDINEEFEDIKKDMKELTKKNKALSKPKDLGKPDEKMEDIEQDLKDSQDQLEQNDNTKASEYQKKASQKMKQMQQKMSGGMSGGGSQQTQEDIKKIRQLLENLIGLSFEQEELLTGIKGTNPHTPLFISQVREQFKLKDDFKMIADSLHEMSKRVIEIESFVSEKILDIEGGFEKGLKFLEERTVDKAVAEQQGIMKNTNDLALMMSDAMENMQMQMSQPNQMCNKPGEGKGKDGKVPMDKIGEGQEQLNKDMQGMKKSKEGKPTSKEFAQMAARQNALKEALRKIKQDMQQHGQGGGQLQEIIDQMEKIEVDLVNKKLTDEMHMRQKDILNRLLEAEKADRQRKWDDKRESKSARQIERTLPPELKKYLEEREQQIEQLYEVSPNLKPFYKQLVEEYYKSLRANQG
jgi:hypothetical protein